MPQGLPRKIKLAFIVQAMLASVAIAILILLGAFVLRQAIVGQTARHEASTFWSEGNPRLLPRGRTMTSFYLPAGQDTSSLPAALQELDAGLHRVPALDRMAYVDDRPEGRFVLLLDTSAIDSTILWTALASIFLALGTSYVMAWWTYRNTKRMVAPVSWLADVVTRWDPRAPDIERIRPHNLPPDAGREVRHLTRALTGLSDRVTAFVQRERDFTRDASHELRTPLTVIRVATDLMMADPDASERQLRSLARVQRAGRDMEAVIDAFLILAREADVEPLSEEFDAREVVAHEVDRVQPLLVGRPIELSIVDQGAPRLFAPPHVLAVMIGNLLGNAVRFTDRGRIDVYLSEDRIEVRDTGIGMSPETLMKAFDPFYRGDPARDEGRGMGLSIVRRLGERFGWPVSLHSTPGEGTSATIQFDSAS